MDTSILFSQYAVPFWAFLGVAVTKAIDFFLERKKVDHNEVKEVATAHANLNKSLQASFEVMSRELTRIREERERDAAAWIAKEQGYTDRIQALEDELTRVQMIVLEAGGCARCGGTGEMLP